MKFFCQEKYLIDKSKKQNFNNLLQPFFQKESWNHFPQVILGLALFCSIQPWQSNLQYFHSENILCCHLKICVIWLSNINLAYCLHPILDGCLPFEWSTFGRCFCSRLLAELKKKILRAFIQKKSSSALNVFFTHFSFTIMLQPDVTGSKLIRNVYFEYLNLPVC